MALDAHGPLIGHLSFATHSGAPFQYGRRLMPLTPNHDDANGAAPKLNHLVGHVDGR